MPHFAPFAPSRAGELRSAHAAATLTQGNAKPEVRLLDRGLDPAVQVKTGQAGEAGVAENRGSGGDDKPSDSRGLVWPTWREQKPKSQARNLNQTAREMEDVAKAPRSSTSDARDMEGLDKTSRKVPRQAPEDILGTPEYYRWRDEEFRQRHPDKEPPGYLTSPGQGIGPLLQPVMASHVRPSPERPTGGPCP